MEGGGDAAGQELAFGVLEGEVGGEGDAGAGLELAFEGVAVDVDDAGQDEEAAGVEGAGVGGGAGGDAAVVQQEVTLGERAFGQHLAAGDP